MPLLLCTWSWHVHVSCCPSYWPKAGRDPRDLPSWLLLVHPVRYITSILRYIFHNKVSGGITLLQRNWQFFTFLRPNSSSSLNLSVSLPTFSGTVMKVSDRRDSGPAPGSSSARASGSLLKSIKLASLGLLPGNQTERCSFSKRSAMSVPTTVLRNRVWEWESCFKTNMTKSHSRFQFQVW